jgi:hypothetical protein
MSSVSAFHSSSDAAAFVQRELGIDEAAVVLEQPPDAHLSHRGLFVGLQHSDEIAIGTEAFCR